MKILISILFALLAISSFGQSVHYVDLNASGNNDGSDWSHAYISLDSALEHAVSGDSIFVRNGIYTPTGSGANSTFSIPDGVQLIGGFTGSETHSAQRLKDSMNTVLEGNIGNPSSATDNIKHMITMENTDDDIVIDGFIVQNAYCIDNVNFGRGAAIYSENGDGDLSIKNCLFRNNYAQDGAGAIYFTGTSGEFRQLWIYDSKFINNSTSSIFNSLGGAIYSKKYVKVKRSEFTGNSSQRGGAIYCYYIEADRSLFDGNSATNTLGGAIYTDLGGQIYNSIIMGNFAKSNAAAIFVPVSQTYNIALYNTTIADNYCDQDSSSVAVSAGKIFCFNSVVYGNRGAKQFAVFPANNSPVIMNSIIEENYSPCTNCYVTDPDFINPGNASNSPFTLGSYNYGLQYNSVGINAGDNSRVHVDFNMDYWGNDRVFGTTVDIGAIEGQYATVNIELESNISSGGILSGEGAVLQDSSTTILASVNPCYQFLYWTERDTFVSDLAEYTFVATKDRKFRAHFSLDSFQIDLSRNITAGGSVSGSGRFACGSTVTLSATPANCFTFEKWTLNGNTVNTNPNANISVSSDEEYIAHFKPTVFTVSTFASPANGGTTSGQGAIPCDSIVTLTATPNSDFKFINWTINGNTVSLSSTFSFKVTQNVSLVANFQSTLGVQDQPDPGLRIYPNPTKGILNVTAHGGYHFVISDMEGKILLKTENSTIDLNSCAPGVYYITCYSDQTVIRLRFVLL